MQYAGHQEKLIMLLQNMSRNSMSYDMIAANKLLDCIVRVTRAVGRLET